MSRATSRGRANWREYAGLRRGRREGERATGGRTIFRVPRRRITGAGSECAQRKAGMRATTDCSQACWGADGAAAKPCRVLIATKDRGTVRTCPSLRDGAGHAREGACTRCDKFAIRSPPTNAGGIKRRRRQRVDQRPTSGATGRPLVRQTKSLLPRGPCYVFLSVGARRDSLIVPEKARPAPCVDTTSKCRTTAPASSLRTLTN